MRIPVVDLAECVVCELCVEVCPEIFSLNQSGYIEVAELLVYPEDQVEEAIRNCPQDCINWEEA